MENPMKHFYLAFESFSQLDQRVGILESQIKVLTSATENTEKDHWTEPAISEDREFINLEEAAKILGYQPSYMYKLRKKGIIPYIKARGRLRFDKKELEAWMLSGRSKIIQIAVDSLVK